LERSDHERRDLDGLREALAPLFGELSDEAVREVAEKGEWVDLAGGGRLIERGSTADAMYVLIHGRLRASVPARDGATRVLGEVAQGEAVGEMGLIGGGVRNADIDAIRDSRLLRLDGRAFQDLTRRHPEFLWNLARLVARRADPALGKRRPVPRLRLIAIDAAAPDDVVREFIDRLNAALSEHGPTTTLDATSARFSLRDESDERALARRLDEIESHHRFVLASIRSEEPQWSRFVVRQADRILRIRRASDPPAPTGSAQEQRPVRAREDLVLLHEAGVTLPSGTSAWLAANPQVHRAHHLRRDRPADFERMARFLAGRAVGLVMAGGGAKGFAHVGILRALEERGVPVDLVGGTSIGAMLAAAVAFGWPEPARREVLQRAFVKTNPANDYQLLPIVSILKGRKIERVLRSIVGETAIEDLWIPFFCVSSNLTRAEKAVHSRGSLWRALRASASLAGVFPPPVIDGEFHVDGGIFDNMPVATARDLDAGHVIACDFRRPTHRRVGFDRVPSGTVLLLDRLLRRRRYRVPGLIPLMMQSSFLAGLERARAAAAEADLFLEPSTSGVRFLEWRALERAARLGHAYAVDRFADPEVNGRLTAMCDPAART
jgi:predicted acylesterase/phospholipase RssA